MTAALNGQKFSSCLGSVHLNDGQWRGICSDFVLHCKDQLRTHNDISVDPHTNGQMVQFLNMAVSDVVGLTSILTLQNTAAAAAGMTIGVIFNKFVQALLDQAQIHDAANAASRNGHSQATLLHQRT